MIELLGLIIMAACIVVAGGMVHLLITTSKSVRRQAHELELEIVRRLPDPYLAWWEDEFPDWKTYVLEKYPSDQWPRPTTYGPPRRPCVHPDWVAVYQLGQAPRLKCTHCGATVHEDLMPKASDPFNLVEDMRRIGMDVVEVGRLVMPGDLSGMRSPQGHGLAYCMCHPCIRLRAEYWSRGGRII